MPAVDIDKKPVWMTKRPSARFLMLAGFAAGVYIALNNPALNSVPAVQPCAKAAAEKPAAACVKINGPQH